MKGTGFGSRIRSVFKVPYALGIAAVAGLLVIAVAGCGAGASKVSDGLIHDYLAKHETMVDASLAGLYIVTEQDGIAEKINSAIAARTADGTLEGLRGATFDFSDLTIEVIGEKEDHINDEIKRFVKVAIQGTFSMRLKDSDRQITADETLILEMEGKVWKVTEKINPWV